MGGSKSAIALNLSNWHDALCEIQTNGDDIRSLGGIQTCALPRETGAGLQGNLLGRLGRASWLLRHDRMSLPCRATKSRLGSRSRYRHA
jgi:hypothetical protein